jgi:hypothetical protein
MDRIICLTTALPSLLFSLSYTRREWFRKGAKPGTAPKRTLRPSKDYQVLRRERVQGLIRSRPTAAVSRRAGNSIILRSSGPQGKKEAAAAVDAAVKTRIKGSTSRQADWSFVAALVEKSRSLDRKSHSGSINDWLAYEPAGERLTLARQFPDTLW